MGTGRILSVEAIYSASVSDRTRAGRGKMPLRGAGDISAGRGVLTEAVDGE